MPSTDEAAQPSGVRSDDGPDLTPDVTPLPAESTGSDGTAPRHRIRRRTLVLGGLGVLGAIAGGGVGLAYYNANRPCPCPLPPTPTPAPGLAELRAAAQRFNTEHGWKSISIFYDDARVYESDASGQAAVLAVEGSLEETVGPAEMREYIVALHEAVAPDLAGAGVTDSPLTVRVNLSSGSGDRERTLGADMVGTTDHALLVACMGVAGAALDGGAAGAHLTGETLTLRHAEADADSLLDPSTWLTVAPADLPAGVVLEQRGGDADEYTGTPEVITRMTTGDDMSAVPLADLAVAARDLRWDELTVEAEGAGAVVRLGESDSGGLRSDRPVGAEDLRAVLDLARGGTWARWIIADGGNGFLGVVLECADGVLSVPQALPALAGPGICLERSRQVLADLG